MDKLMRLLLDAGYYVWFEPGKYNAETRARESGGCTACIQSERARIVGVRDEDWRAHAATPEAALRTAAQKMIDHLRPAHDIYERLCATEASR